MKSNFLGDRAQAAIFRAPDGDLVEQEQVRRLLARCESRDEALRLICDLAEETVPGAVARDGARRSRGCDDRPRQW